MHLNTYPVLYVLLTHVHTIFAIYMRVLLLHALVVYINTHPGICITLYLVIIPDMTFITNGDVTCTCISVCHLLLHMHIHYFLHLYDLPVCHLFLYSSACYVSFASSAVMIVFIIFCCIHLYVISVCHLFLYLPTCYPSLPTLAVMFMFFQCVTFCRYIHHDSNLVLPVVLCFRCLESGGDTLHAGLWSSSFPRGQWQWNPDHDYGL